MSEPNRAAAASAAVAESAGRGRGFTRLLSFTHPYMGKLVEATVCMVVISFIMLSIPWGFRIVIDEAIPDGNMSLMTWILIAILIVHAFRMVFYYVGRYLITYVGQRVIFDLRERLFEHLQRLSMRFYDERGTGEIVSRVMSDVSALEGLIDWGVIRVITNLLQLTAVLVVLFWMSARMTLIALVTLPTLGVVVAIFRKRVHEASRGVRQNVAQMHRKLMEVVPGVKVVKAFTAEYRERKSFERILEQGVNLNLVRGVLGIHYVIWSEYLVAIGTALVLWYGGRLVATTPSFTIGELVAFYAYVSMLYAPVRELAMLANQIMPARAATERIFEILDLQPDIVDAPDAIQIDKLQGEVEFKNVNFSYREKSPVLRDVSFRVRAGQKVALVGRSGCGKTTVSNLIMRLYDPDEGRVLADGRDIRQFRIRSYRKRIGLVMQEALLLGGTIEDNIRYGNPRATVEEVHRAAEVANVTEFAQELPDALKTQVGESGAQLSAGQKQRVAIARALLVNPDILVLDEMSSALDSITETKVQQALERLLENRTVFIIAHRLSSIRDADVVIVMKGGRIVQMGAPDELLMKPGLFRELVEAGPESWMLGELEDAELRQPSSG